MPYESTAALAIDDMPVSVAQLKERARIFHANDDSWLDELILAAYFAAEHYLNRVIVSQTMELFLDDFPAGEKICLPGGELSSVTTVKYYNTSDVLTTYDSANYYVDTKKEPGEIKLKASVSSWPEVKDGRPNAVEVAFVAGYSTVPELIKQGILEHALHLYRFRSPVENAFGTVIEVPAFITRIYKDYKLWGGWHG